MQDFALSVADGWNDIRILDKVERGILTAADVAAEKAKFVVAQAITNVERKADLFLRKYGAKFGAKLKWVHLQVQFLVLQELSLAVRLVALSVKKQGLG
ncbi:hypothetical protein [Aggregatibacter actinomycetemcomitans]|uniref:hypothetical protein n=1 Tax=Aggregatibacter actinomycetemcomitans TaxID=714 RepID=UPI00077E766B|nr:hypothetical protein [Aggregatibacter actinomycetemcomitans]KYK92767.1 hypothetical protein ANH9776_09055 [Aggregatibacter actinomycetemcomitans serotype e str. ANH9776]